MSTVLAFPKSAVVRRPRRKKSADRALAQEISGVSDALMDWGLVSFEAKTMRYLLDDLNRLHAKLVDAIEEARPA